MGQEGNTVIFPLIMAAAVVSTKSTISLSASKTLWNGPYFGRLPKYGRLFLEQHGWRWLDDSNSQQYDPAGPDSPGTRPLAFIWPNKSGPQFCSLECVCPAMVRPYPTPITDRIDDKVRLQSLMEDTGFIPQSIITSPQHQASPIERYFVKHRWGAKGKSVYAYNQSQLIDWWNRTSSHHDWVIQREVPPALDSSGRKFVIRSHVLVEATSVAIRSFLHTDMIVLTHSTPYNRQTDSRAAHISSIGKKHPKPVLLEQLSDDHPAARFSVKNAIQDMCGTLIQKADFPKPATALSCFALLGLDHLVSEEGKTVLCEVNSHPALGWGTMAKVDQQIFVRLVEDMLSILLLGADEENTGFCKL